MRLFDVVGAIAVAGWLGIVGLYVYELNFAQAAEDVGGEAVFAPGESWMILTREDEEVGYIHETRTELTEGWLLEYDLVMNVSMLGVDQYLRTVIKASVNRDAVLDEFSGTMETANKEFDIDGTVDGNTVVMSMDIGGGVREQRIELKQPPRLSNSALNQLVAQDDLEPGTTFKEKYFDPTSMGMRTMTFEYVRPHDVEVYGEKIPTYHFRQLVGGNELDVYVDDHGEVYIQEFPFRIIGARMPAELGRARAQNIRRKFEKRVASGELGAFDLSMEAAVGLLKKGSAAPLGHTRYRINAIPEGVALELESARQSVVSKKETIAVIDTSKRGKVATLDETQRDQFLATSLRIDSDAEVFADLLGDKPHPRSTTARAERLARAIKKRVKVRGDVAIQSASQVLEDGHGDCTEYSLALVAALRAYDIPARFVFGVKKTDDGFVPHQWVQYDNGDEWADIDATTDTMLPGFGHIQLLTSPDPEHSEYVHILDQVTVEPMGQPEPETDVGDAPPSDFN